MNKIKENFSFAWIYSPYVLSVSIIILVLISLLFDVGAIQFAKLALVVFSLSLIAINIIGGIRRKELTKIKNIITGIRQNKYSDPNQILLGKYLNALEDEIKSMFFKTQSDIANLKKLEHVRTEFLGNVSHELRTPIFAIQGFLETLLNGAIDDPKVNRNFLMKANQHTINLNNLLNDLIDISMIESGEMKMSFRYFKLEDFFNSIHNEMKIHADNKGIDLKFITAGNNIQVFGDKEKLKQVMVNLIINAIKYTETGTVEIGAVEIEKTCKIFVKDTGIGILEKDLGRIFERFYRVDKDRSRAVGGTGLGLAIVKHIIEAHGSKIEVISKPGFGSEFSFSLKK